MYERVANVRLRWSTEEDQKLLGELKARVPLNQIANNHERPLDSIKLRIQQHALCRMRIYNDMIENTSRELNIPVNILNEFNKEYDAGRITMPNLIRHNCIYSDINVNTVNVYNTVATLNQMKLNSLQSGMNTSQIGVNSAQIGGKRRQSGLSYEDKNTKFRWTNEEDENLLRELKQKMGVDEIANIHQRTIRGIKTRLMGHAIYRIMVRNDPIESVSEELNLPMELLEKYNFKDINKVLINNTIHNFYTSRGNTQIVVGK